MDSQLDMQDMKKLFILLLLIIAINTQGQNNYMNNDEIQSFLDSMIVHKDQFVGKTMGVIYNLFDQARLPMRYFSIGETSPWIDSEGKSFLTDVILYSETLEDMNDGKEYYDIRFELDIPKIDAGAFYRSLPTDSYSIWWNAFKQRTMDMPIKDIRYFRDIMPMHF